MQQENGQKLKGEGMDGQNYNNGSSQDMYQQNQQTSQGQQDHYQDNTANMSYYAPVKEDVPYKANGLQIGGLVLGIMSIVFVCCYGYPSVLFGIIGLILSIVGNNKGKHGIGTAGLICSVIGLVLGAISAIYYTSLIAEIIKMMQTGDFNPYDYYRF